MRNPDGSSSTVRQAQQERLLTEAELDGSRCVGVSLKNNIFLIEQYPLVN